MRIGLDATYSLGDALSGVGVYSREILHGLAQTDFAEGWDWFYRPKPFLRARNNAHPPGVRPRLLTDSIGSRSASLFHGLNQRLPKRAFQTNVVTFHDLFVLSGEYSTPEFRARFTAQARDAAARADRIVAVSAFTARQIEQYLNIPASSIDVIHHGVLPREIPDLPRENIVLCVGAIQRRKNQAGLVRAFRSMPSDWRLILAGSQGYGAEETLRKIGDRVEITGYIDDADLARLYARARIFAFPSFDEGFGMPVLEAMAAGVPVITSNRSALPEVAGGAAILVDPANDDEFAAALELLAKNDERRDQLAALGKSHAAGFTWPKAVQQTLDVYSTLLRRP